MNQPTFTVTNIIQNNIENRNDRYKHILISSILTRFCVFDIQQTLGYVENIIIQILYIQQQQLSNKLKKVIKMKKDDHRKKCYKNRSIKYHISNQKLYLTKMGNQEIQNQTIDKDLLQAGQEKRDHQLTEEHNSIEEDHNAQIECDKQMQKIQVQWKLMAQQIQTNENQQTSNLPNIKNYFQLQKIDQVIKYNAGVPNKIQVDNKYFILQKHYIPEEQKQIPVVHIEEKPIIAETLILVEKVDVKNHQNQQSVPTIQFSSLQEKPIQTLIKENEKYSAQKKIVILKQDIDQQIHKQIQLECRVTQFSKTLKSKTILLDESTSLSSQDALYYQNQKIILTDKLTSQNAEAYFQITNLKYCIGMGIALKEVIEGHSFNYKSYENELSHGLYIVTSQGYSWSHSNKIDDDQYRPFFSKMKTNDIVKVNICHLTITFSCKQGKFDMEIPQSVAKKYTICFCAYLHEKKDSIRLLSDGFNIISQ